MDTGNPRDVADTTFDAGRPGGSARAEHARRRARDDVRRRDVGGWLSPRSTLYVGRRDQSRLLHAARTQRALVEQALGGAAPVHAALCFTGVELPFFARPFACEGVLVTWPKALARALAAPGPLGVGDRAALAGRLARAFPPYAR